MSKETVLEQYKNYTQALKEMSIRSAQISKDLQALKIEDANWVVKEHLKWLKANFPSDIKF